MSYSFFSTPFTGATTVSAEEEILEGEEVVISSLSFVNARTPEVLLKVLLDNRCFKFLLLSPWTNLNDAPRDLWWFFFCKMEDVDVDVDEEEKILHLDEEEEDKEDTAVLMEDTDVIVAALMSCVYARASNLKILNLLLNKRLVDLTLSRFSLHSLFLSRFF